MAKTPHIPLESGVGHKRPPVHSRFKPGNPGGPGRPPAGVTILEHINGFVMADTSAKALKRIAKDENEGVARRIAARRLLSAVDQNDLADFTPLVEGEMTLAQLRAKGVDTTIVKKSKTRFLKDGGIEREVELRDEAANDFDRILDRTIGKPKQEVTQHVDGTLRTPAEGETAADTILARIADRLGSKRN